MSSIGERMARAGRDKWGDQWRIELGAATGIRRQTLSKIEHGSTKNPTPTNLFAIAEALGVEAKWLGTGKGPREPASSLRDDQRRWLALQEGLSDEQQQSLARFLDPLGKLPSDEPAGNGH